MAIIPKIFEFSSYQFEAGNRRLYFNYKIEFENRDPLYFRETIELPKAPKLEKLPEELLNNILQGVHLILGISYYKLYCPKEIRLNSQLTKLQAEFWNQVYHQGLGEFYYRNNIDPTNSPVFPYTEDYQTVSHPLPKGNKSLVGIGGGKDSIVAVELLKDQGERVSAFVLETQKPAKIIENVISELGIGTVKIKRFLDPKIFEKYEDSYNGHIPISAVIAFLSLLSAVLYSYDYVIVGNEYSSNFGNLEYRGEKINHQWSKSSEFEKLFQNYTRDFITTSTVYFSALRPYYEIRIVKMFAEMKKYFSHFSSCNKSFLVNEDRPKTLWCGECPKCAFMFMLLSAFLTKKELLNIFKKNLYQDEKLLSTYSDLLGLGELKPFECVGTFEESQAALYLARSKFKNDFIVRTLLPRLVDPKTALRQVMKTNRADEIPTKFKFLGAKNVLIIGYGREGKVTHRFLNKYYKNLKVGVADKKFNQNYLDKQNDYDVAIKTPGMPPSMITIPYTTATNLFFFELKKRGNQLIGVTGSKGKSTTTSLIYAILKEAGLDVELLGNIGIPMLSALMKPVKKSHIFVLELSSYMLSDLQFSPNVAVVTNLFPEHMDYHGGIEEYYQAKKNIINYQTASDHLVYNSQNARLVDWASEARAATHQFADSIPLDDEKIPLLGSHNRENIKAAVAAARIFGVSDEIIARAISKFQPLRHRLELVGEYRGIKFYDDAISTTPESTIAAIKAIPNVGTIFLGGQDRGYDFDQLEQVLKENRIKNIVLFPDSGHRILRTRDDFNVIETSSMEEAVKFAYQHTQNGQVCLLSTASPSYSVWKDFEAKGEEFQFQVKRIGEIT